MTTEFSAYTTKFLEVSKSDRHYLSKGTLRALASILKNCNDINSKPLVVGIPHIECINKLI